MDWFGGILEKGVKELMPTPLVNISEISLVKDGAADEIFAKVAEKMAAESNPGIKTMYQVNLEWMKRMLKSVSIPMALHHTQVITALCFAEFYQRHIDKDHIYHEDPERKGSKIPVTALIAQVGTGEGKSVVIATLALYFVVVHGKKVHILENNRGLLERDFESFKEFYGNFERPDGKQVKVSSSLNPDADICYCLNDEIDRFYRNSVFQNSGGSGNAFKDLIMIVDEVDELVVDKKPTTTYVKPDREYSQAYAVAMKALLADPDSAHSDTCPQPLTVPEMWNKAKSAKREASHKRKNVDYGMADGKFVMLDKRGRVTSSTTSWLQWLNFELNPKKAPPYQTVFYTNSRPYVFKQYECLFGLTGSVGGKAEKDFLVRTYGAKMFKVPSFLDTCQGQAGHCATFLKPVALCSGKEEHHKTIAQFVKKHHQKVPVLVICETPEVAKTVFQKLKSLIGETKVQFLLERDIEKRTTVSRAEIAATVDKATKTWQGHEEGAGPWTTTVTDYFGGRGLDYQVSSDTVNDNGGLMVVMTSIPDSEREWIQWKGRTARQDRNGQYKVILDETDDVFNMEGGIERLQSSIGVEEDHDDDDGGDEAPSPWYFPKMDRATSQKYLKGKPHGSFVVRESARADAAFTLMFSVELKPNSGGPSGKCDIQARSKSACMHAHKGQLTCTVCSSCVCDVCVRVRVS